MKIKGMLEGFNKSGIQARLNKTGIQHAEQGQYAKALEYYEQALAIQPDYARAWRNKAVSHIALKQYPEAVSALREALRHYPEYPDNVLGACMEAQALIFDWADLEADLETAKRQFAAGNMPLSPFATLLFFDNPVLQQRVAQAYSAYELPPTQPALPAWPRACDSKLRMGYFSPDFRNHPLAHLMYEYFQFQDRSRVESIAFYLGRRKDQVQHKRLRHCFDRFFDVAGHSSKSIVALARDLRIDVAVDLAGYTTNNRFELFNFRVAPIQISYLGFPGTIGSDCIDYQIADHVVVDASNRPFHDEQIIYMPDTYWSITSIPDTAGLESSRKNEGLPPEAMVYCCFNNTNKIRPDRFALWMRILQQVPNSVLWLLGDNEIAQHNARRHAAEHDVAPERLVFSARVERKQHLVRYRLADLFLDTLPCNAHTTAYEALLMGLPVLTQIGNSFAGRVAASQLSVLNLQELITCTDIEYEALAVSLAKDSPRLAGFRHKLTDQHASSPLFNVERFTRHMEQALFMANERLRVGLPPADFDVPRLFG